MPGCPVFQLPRYRHSSESCTQWHAPFWISRAWPCDSGCLRVALVASRWEDPVQVVLAGSHVASRTHAGIYLRPSDIGCQYSRSIYSVHFIMWQSRRATDTSTNWRQSLFCCCTASMEQAADGAETAAIDGLVLSLSENISVSFCLRALGYGLTLWCALGLLVVGTIQVPQLQLQLHLLYTTTETGLGDQPPT